jgi:poly(A) polymerase/tRNA nucleotidyltransferase (CCA-adding enzyme)
MDIPNEVKIILDALNEAGHEAYVVGGCVRDLLLNREPNDWDVATNATPKDIQKIFPKNFYNNTFGTVTVITKSKIMALKNIEVTTYRVDGKYSDQRRPDEVKYTGDLKEDLARRDFTVNAMALSFPSDKVDSDLVVIDGMQIIDPFGGLKDLDAKLIRAVGNANERFEEDALRLMRALRFAAQLGFEVEDETLKATKEKATDINAVSQERIRDEIIKIVLSASPEKGMNLLQETGILKEVLPEIEKGVGVKQNKHHTYTVYEHSVKSLQFAAKYNYELSIRLAALLHDVGKPKTRRPKGNDFTFYAHDMVGARMTEKIMKRLRFSNDLIKKVVHLVRYHMFYYDVGKVTETGARRLLRRVGREHFDDLIKLRIAERKGSGVPKAEPYRLRHLQFLVEKASKQPVSVGELNIGGGDLIKELKLRPGPMIGGILNALLADVLDDPRKNKKKYLLKRAKELKDKDPKSLKSLGESAKDEEEKRRDEEIKRKYHV